MTCQVADMDELVYVKLEWEIAELLIKVDVKYEQFLTYEHGQPVIYAELSKALYGTLQAALLFWQNLTNFLVKEHSFTVNPYDWYMANKTINGKQCTIRWYMDDLKISHKDPSTVETIVTTLQEWYRKETPLVVHQEKTHDYLSMDQYI